jgi:hypothetical protein
MQKLSGKTMVVFTTNPTKLGLHFSDFSTIFYEFSKFQPNCFTIEVSTLHRSTFPQKKNSCGQPPQESRRRVLSSQRAVPFLFPSRRRPCLRRVPDRHGPLFLFLAAASTQQVGRHLPFSHPSPLLSDPSPLLSTS